MKAASTRGAAESFGFRAGSYSGYNRWREQLAALAGWPQKLYHSRHESPRMSNAASAWEADSGTFWELINFSDCEGCIGPKTAGKLARDFAEYQWMANAHPDDYFRQKYAEWRRALEMAADGGAVCFH